MIQIQNIPHLTVYRQKAYLPIDEKTTTLYSIIYMNNPTFDSSIDFMNHAKLLSNHKYFNYYTDFLFKEKISTKSIVANYKNKRLEMYKTVDDKMKMFNTHLKFEQIRNHNVYYDMCLQNEVFFKNIKSQPIAKKVEMYIKYMMKIINDKRFDTYKYKTIVIDVERWEQNSDPLNNPIMYIFLAFKKYFEVFSTMGDINIIFYTKDLALRLNPSLCEDTTFNLFKSKLTYLYKKINLNDDKAIDTAVDADDIKAKVYTNMDVEFNFVGSDMPTGDEADDEDVDYSDIIDDAIDSKVSKSEDSDEDDVLAPLKEPNADKELTKKEVEDKLTQKLSNDEVLIKNMTKTLTTKMTGKTTASLKRDEELRAKQRELKFKNMKISDFNAINERNLPITVNNVSNTVPTTNANMTNIKFANFEKSYNDTLMSKDTMNILLNLNDKSIPVYIKNIDVVDSSDILNYKETYNITLEDANRVRHNIKVDMPKFIDDKFVYLNGNKKVIIKQLFMKPIVKTGPDEVQVCSNYNKIFIRRYGNKISPKIEQLKKALSNTIVGMTIKTGDNSIINNKYKTVLEYDELSKSFDTIKSGKIEIIFNQEIVRATLGSRISDINGLCIGFNDGKPIVVDFETERDTEGHDIVDIILSLFGDKIAGHYKASESNSKRYVYSRAVIMAKQIPIILLLGYCEGLTTVLKKANIKHYFSDKRPTLKDDEDFIKFSDGYLIYNKYPFENALLLNALDTIPTKSFEYADFDDKGTYVELFDIMYGARNLANAFDSFYEFMIDPITKNVLEDMDYPTDFVSVILFANALLADNSYITENNMNLYRVRSNEIVNAMLHKQIADAYSKYRATANNKHPVKISIPQNAILKQLLTSTTVEEFSTLNPIYEIEKMRSITPKGLNGMNLANAYTQDKRSYDKTMLGLIGMSTSPDANVGVVRHLSMEPNIKSPRGYIDINDDDMNKLNDVNLFTPAELLSPLGVTRDDSIRTAMATKQSGHIIPVKKSSPVLISNGAEQVVQYYLSKDFVIVAEEDGEVVEIDDKTGLIVVKYKSGKVQAIDTNPRVAKNSASGFYTSVKLKTDLTIGKKVKKNDVLASEEKFFSNDKVNGNRFNIGSFQKVAVMSSYATYEDLSFITKKMSQDMASEIIMMKDVVIGKNANVDRIVSVGDHVEMGDTLVSFETSYDEAGLNKFLASIGDDLKEEIKSLNKVPIKSKYTGTIEDIKIYSSTDISELSPSLQKIVSKYYAGINKKKQILDKYDKNSGIIKAGILFNEPTGKITESSDGKLKGREVFDGVLIEFYIKYQDPVTVGDKIAFFTALKSVVGEVIDEGYEPFSEFRPDEEISSFIGPAAILQRMTPSILLTMFGNKVLVELKRSLEEIYKS